MARSLDVARAASKRHANSISERQCQSAESCRRGGADAFARGPSDVLTGREALAFDALQTLEAESVIAEIRQRARSLNSPGSATEARAWPSVLSIQLAGGVGFQ